jgi:hypothetical protein
MPGDACTLKPLGYSSAGATTSLGAPSVASATQRSVKAAVSGEKRISAWA